MCDGVAAGGQLLFRDADPVVTAVLSAGAYLGGRGGLNPES